MSAAVGSVVIPTGTTYNSAQGNLADISNQIAQYHANYAPNLQNEENSLNSTTGGVNDLQNTVNGIVNSINSTQGQEAATPGLVEGQTRGFDVNAAQLKGQTNDQLAPLKSAVTQLTQNKTMTDSQLSQAKAAVTQALDLYKSNQSNTLSNLTASKSATQKIVDQITSSINKANTAAKPTAAETTASNNATALQKAVTTYFTNGANNWDAAYNTIKSTTSGLSTAKGDNEIDQALISSLVNIGVPQNIVNQGLQAVQSGQMTGQQWWTNVGQQAAGFVAK